MNGEKFVIKTTYDFSTYDVFAIDNNVTVNIHSTITKPNLVESIVFIQARPPENMSTLISDDFKRGLELLNQRGLVFVAWPIKEDKTEFVFRTDSFKPILRGEFTLIPVIQIGPQHYVMTQTTSLIEIELAVSKLQADSIHETQIFNNYVLGLSWIMVALVLIGFSLEAFIQRYFFFHPQNN